MILSWILQHRRALALGGGILLVLAMATAALRGRETRLRRELEQVVQEKTALQHVLQETTTRLQQEVRQAQSHQERHTMREPVLLANGTIGYRDQVDEKSDSSEFQARIEDYRAQLQVQDQQLVDLHSQVHQLETRLSKPAGHSTTLLAGYRPLQDELVAQLQASAGILVLGAANPLPIGIQGYKVLKWDPQVLVGIQLPF